MANDNTAFVRQAAIEMLKGDVTLTGLVADRVYPRQAPSNPVWPFVMYGRPITSPFVASGMDGSATAVAIHVYAQTDGEGDATVDGETLCDRIMARVVAVLGGDEGAEISLAGTDCPYPATAHFNWTGSQTLQDTGEADRFHGIASFNISVGC